MILCSFRHSLFTRIFCVFMCFIILFLAFINLTCVKPKALAQALPEVLDLLAAVLISCGLSFATADQANSAANNIWDKLSETVHNKILSALVGVELVADQIVEVNLAKDVYYAICQLVTATYGAYVTSSIISDLSYTSTFSDYTGLLSSFTVSGFDSVNGKTVVDVGHNITLTLYGTKVANPVGNAYSLYNTPDLPNLGILSFGSTGFFSYCSHYTGVKWDGTYNITYGFDSNGYPLITLDNVYSGSMSVISRFLTYPLSLRVGADKLYHFYINHVPGASSAWTEYRLDQVINDKTIEVDVTSTKWLIDYKWVPDPDDPNSQKDPNSNNFPSFDDAIKFITSLIFADAAVKILPNFFPGNDTYPSTGDNVTQDNVYPDTSKWPDNIPVGVGDNVADTIKLTPDQIRNPSSSGSGSGTGGGTVDPTSPTSPTNSPTDNSTPSKDLDLPKILFYDKFPFCLPWDLYNTFVSLKSEPVPPKFTVPFKLERLNIDYSFDIDLSQFEEFAMISRYSLSVIFVIALILLTRKLIGA